MPFRSHADVGPRFARWRGRRSTGGKRAALMGLIASALTPAIAAIQEAQADATGPVLLGNTYVLVERGASGTTRSDLRRVVVAVGESDIAVDRERRTLRRGDVLLVARDRELAVEKSGAVVLVSIRANHPPGLAPAQPRPPEKNCPVLEEPDFMVYEEALAPGDIRAAHTHNTRLTLVLNATRLRGGNDLVYPQVPNSIRFIPDAATHGAVTNVGDVPLRNVVIEFKVIPPPTPSP